MYKSLDTIPYKTFIKIIDTGVVYHISNEDKDQEDFTIDEIEKFTSTWDLIYKAYLELAPNEEDRKLLNTKREIEFFETKHKLIIMCCDCLKFEWNDEIVALLRGFGYQLNDNKNYITEIEIIEREAEALLVKCDRFIKMLPQDKDDNSNKSKGGIDDMLASFSAILGIDFDYNTISFTKTMALKKQVEAKIKQLDNSQPKI